jgi:hypothetical protein
MTTEKPSKVERLRAKLAEAEMREAIKKDPVLKQTVRLLHNLDKVIALSLKESNGAGSDLSDTLISSRRAIEATLVGPDAKPMKVPERKARAAPKPRLVPAEKKKRAAKA